MPTWNTKLSNPGIDPSATSFVSTLPPSQTVLSCKQQKLGVGALATVTEVPTSFSCKMLVFVRKHSNYLTDFCGNVSFSFAVFKVQLCCEAFCFVYDSCHKHSKMKERKNQEGFCRIVCVL